MKILKNITLVFILMIFLSCSKDDKNTVERTFAELSGTWEVTSYEYEGNTTYRSITTDENWNTSFFGAGWLLDFSIVFAESPNDFSVTGNHNVDHYFTDQDGQEFFYYANLERSESGTYTRNSNTSLTFNEQGVYKQGTIQELDETTLKFSTSESSSETNSDNVLISTIRTEIYILNRIN